MPPDPEDHRLGEFDWLVFTSGNGVRYFLAVDSAAKFAGQPVQMKGDRRGLGELAALVCQAAHQPDPG